MDNNITVLGVGNTLYRDNGVGVRVVEILTRAYEFSNNVIIVDGGVPDINFLGIMANTSRLIVVDTVSNHGRPGDIHFLDHQAIQNRTLAKNTPHQVDLIEALTLCETFEHVPYTTIIGIEPKDLVTRDENLTPEIKKRLPDLTQAVLDEIIRCGGAYTPKTVGPPYK